MAGNTKALRTRIKSVNSTLQLTKAMGLVASSKVYKANLALNRARQYSAAFDSAIERLMGDSECQKSPFAAQRENGRTKIIIIAGDRGLAGGYNANIFRLAATLEGAEFIPIGKRACERFGKQIISSEHFSFHDAKALSDKLCDEFAAGEFDKLGILYTKYRSVMVQEAAINWVLPLQKSESSAAATVYEPNAITVLETAVKEYVAGIIGAAIRESFASEVAARRAAMDSAGKNAKQMIDELQLQYNRARQGAITQEITEIVAGSGN